MPGVIMVDNTLKPQANRKVMLPPSCERALLERFLKAEAMAMWAVRAAQRREVPPHVLRFLHRHEQDERRHLEIFEGLLGTRHWKKDALPRVPSQWGALAVHLYGYETLGLEFAKLLATVRPDLASIVKDEEVHVGFFERRIREILMGDESQAACARLCARAWWRRLPRTLDRYLGDAAFAPYRNDLRAAMLASIEGRFSRVGLFDGDGPLEFFR